MANRIEHQRYMLISCAVLARECYTCAAVSRNAVDIKIIEQGLHDVGEAKMSAALQRELEAIPVDKYDAILLAYGLCNNGIRKLHAGLPLVVPRAHDCITLLLGSKEKYTELFNAYPGSFFGSVGWMERAQDNLANPESTTKQIGMGTYEEYVEQYGEENARYLMETLGEPLKHYSRSIYIDTGLPHTEAHKQACRDMAAREGWEFTEVSGSMRLIEKMMNGKWEESEFLVLRPGQSIDTSYDDDIVKAVDGGET